MRNFEDVYETPEILISGEIDKMEITALNIKAMTEMFIAKDDDPDNLVYYIDIKKIFDGAGIVYNRFTFRRFRDIGAKELAEKNKYIGFVNEDGDFEQMPYFQDIVWLESEGQIKVTLAQRFKEIYTNPSLKKIKGHLKDTLALKTKYAARMFPKLILRYNKSQNGRKKISLKQDGSLQGKKFLDIWPIKKFRREFSMKESTYVTGAVKNACEAIAEDITQNTGYNCNVYCNYWKDPDVKHANQSITHICWDLSRKSSMIVQDSFETDDMNIHETGALRYASEIVALGYNTQDAEILSETLVRNHEDIGYFKSLHEYMSSRKDRINSRVGWLISGIEQHYEIKNGKTMFNDFEQRNYDFQAIEKKLRK